MFIESERLLRKGSLRLRKDQETFKDEARESVVNVLNRDPFDCDVAVYIDPESQPQQPLMPPVVKAYLDALEGIAYQK